MKGMGISKYLVILLLVFSSCIDALDMDPTLDVNGVNHPLSHSDISELTEEMKNAAQNHGFVMNRGQLGTDEVKFYTRAPNGGISFCTSSVVITVKEPITSEIWMNYPEAFESTSSGFEPILPGETRMRACNVLYAFEGSNDVIPIGFEVLPNYNNYFIGNDSSRWVSRVPIYRGVVYEGLYDGIDLVYRFEDGVLKYEFIVQPHVDPGIIMVRVEGLDSMEVTSGDGLVISTPAGDIEDRGLRVFQRDDPDRTIPSGFRIVDGNHFGFDIGEYDPGEVLVIDPLVYSTYFGGSDFEAYRHCDIDGDDRVYLTGQTMSDDYPITPGALQSEFIASQFKAFISVLNANGTDLEYSTYLGGSQNDGAFEIWVDDEGAQYVTGWTDSGDFPVTPGAYQSSHGLGDDGDIFVCKLSKDGDQLLYSTCIGGWGFDCGCGIAVDDDGYAYIGGWSESIDFPTEPDDPIQNEIAGGERDAILSKLNVDGSSLVYSTYLGGDGYEYGSDIALDEERNVYITGYTSSDDYPTTSGAFQVNKPGLSNTFISKVNTSGTSLVYSSYLGGSGRGHGEGIAVDSDGNAYIVGYTQSTNFPTTEFAFQRRNAGREDAFVCKFDANGSRQMFSTLIGGTLRDRGSDITLMTNDSVALVGETYSRNFPTSGGPEQNTNAGGREAFVVVFESNGSDLEYSTYLGGSSGDWGLAQVLSSDGFIIATGISQSLDFPTTDDAYQSNHVGKHDIFVSKIERDLDGPFADAGPDQIVDQHTNVSFNGSLSTDDYGIATWTWMFEYEGTEIRLFQALPHFVFDVAGVYEVILNVTDGAGFWAIDRMNVTVLDTTPPYAFAGMDVVIDQHGTVFLDGTGSTDNVGIVNWTWEFTYAGDEVTLYHYNVT